MYKATLVLIDFLIIFTSFILSLLLKFHGITDAVNNQWSTLCFVLVVTPVVFYYFDLYNRLFYTQQLRFFFRMLKAWLVIFLLYIIAGFLTKFYFLVESRVFIFLFFAATISLFFVFRLVLVRFYLETYYASYRRRACWFIGPDSSFDMFKQYFDDNKITGCELIKMPGDGGQQSATRDAFLFSMTDRFDELYMQIKDSLNRHSQVHIASELFNTLNLGWEWCRIDSLPVYTFRCKKKQRVRDAVRRVMDIAGSIIGLVVLSPFFALIAFAILLDSRGPVIYKQVRCGKRGKQFVFYKFRSMTDHKKSDGEPANEVDYFRSHGVPKTEAMNNDCITEVGRILRKTSMDEWPQFINVLKGDMGLVGPRPQQPHEIRSYAEWHTDRLSVKQGLTGLWQIYGRGELPSNKSIFLDLTYVINRSLTLDIKLLFQTIPAVILGRGAY